MQVAGILGTIMIALAGGLVFESLDPKGSSDDKFKRACYACSWGLRLRYWNTVGLDDLENLELMNLYFTVRLNELEHVVLRYVCIQ